MVDLKKLQHNFENLEIHNWHFHFLLLILYLADMFYIYFPIDRWDNFGQLFEYINLNSRNIHSYINHRCFHLCNRDNFKSNYSQGYRHYLINKNFFDTLCKYWKLDTVYSRKYPLDRRDIIFYLNAGSIPIYIENINHQKDWIECNLIQWEFFLDKILNLNNF